jgi:hypothetical protein
VHHLVQLYVASYLADLFGMYTRKTSSKYGEILTENVSYLSADKAIAPYYWITRILNKKKVYSSWTSTTIQKYSRSFDNLLHIRKYPTF